jgi:hypothetical protein
MKANNTPQRNTNTTCGTNSRQSNTTNAITNYFVQLDDTTTTNGTSGTSTTTNKRKVDHDPNYVNPRYY